MVRPDHNRLRGTVEVDETYWDGEEKGFVERLTDNKAIIFVAIDERGNGIGRIRIRHISGLTQESLHGFITYSIELGSIVGKDGFKFYLGLTDYVHNHQVRSRQRKGELLLHPVHRVVPLLKRWLLGNYHGATHQQHLDYYLCEFKFRFSHHTPALRGKLFWQLFQEALQGDLAPCRSIAGSKHKYNQ